MKRAEKSEDSLPPVHRAAITAAGPSLNLQIPELRKRKNGLFLIASDTSLPCLLSEGIIPDAVVSIDCQHISYYHFMAGLPEESLLFVDLASPPLVASRSEKVRFFSGNHPLTSYISQVWRPLPVVDTSGGNVTYASVALAERLGAEYIELYGADFSYPAGLSYARGTYIHPHFEMRQNRLASLESLHSAFLFRGPFVKKTGKNGWYYESPSLSFYRERLQEKCRTSDFTLIPHEGLGAPIEVPLKGADRKPETGFGSFDRTALIRAEDFLVQYREAIKKNDRLVFTTLLPLAAALKRRYPELKSADIIEKTRKYCIEEIERIAGLRAYP